MMNAGEQVSRSTRKLHNLWLSVVQVLLVTVLTYGVLCVYNYMHVVVQILDTMLVGWSVMLDVLIKSELLDGPEKLGELTKWILEHSSNSSRM